MKKILDFIHSQRGAVGMGTMLMLGISMIFIAVGIIMYPTILSGTDSILAWTKSGTYAATPVVAGVSSHPWTITDANFTGLTSVTGVSPLLALIGFISVAIINGLMGFRHGSANPNKGGLLMEGLSLVFMAIGFIIFPVVMEGAATAITNNTVQGGTYTGLLSVLYIVPLLVLIAFVSASVITGYFGGKSLTSD